METLKDPELTAEQQKMLGNMQRADSTVGAETAKPVDEVVGGSSEDLLNHYKQLAESMSPEAMDALMGIVEESGKVAVEATVEPVADTNLPAEAPSAASTVDATDDQPLAPVIPIASRRTQPSPGSAVGLVSDLINNSKFVQRGLRRAHAREEQEWRRSVRQENSQAVRQDVRDAKLNLKIAEQTYGRAGQRILRRETRQDIRGQLKSEISDRQARGDLSSWQARRLKFSARGKARELAFQIVSAEANGKIFAANKLVEQSKTRKENFFNQYGIRANTARKNVKRGLERKATGTSYDYYDIPTSQRPSLKEQWQQYQVEEQARKAQEKAEKNRERARKAAATRARNRQARAA